MKKPTSHTFLSLAVRFLIFHKINGNLNYPTGSGEKHTKTIQLNSELDSELDSSFYKSLEYEIRKSLINPADVEHQRAPSLETLTKFKQLSALNNSPRNVYSSNSGEEFTRNVRGISQFGPVEVDSYKFTFNVNPAATDLVDNAVLRMWKKRMPKYLRPSRKTQTSGAQKPESQKPGSQKPGSQKSQKLDFSPEYYTNPFTSAYVSLQDSLSQEIVASEVVEVNKPGWVKLDVTDFITDVLVDERRNDTSIELDIIIESMSNHQMAIETARKVLLAGQAIKSKSRRPTLAVHTINGRRWLARQEKYRTCKNPSYSAFENNGLDLVVLKRHFKTLF